MYTCSHHSRSFQILLPDIRIFKNACIIARDGGGGTISFLKCRTNMRRHLRLWECTWLNTSLKTIFFLWGAYFCTIYRMQLKYELLHFLNYPVLLGGKNASGIQVMLTVYESLYFFPLFAAQGLLAADD